jgi:hypothetical protein
MSNEGFEGGEGDREELKKKYFDAWGSLLSIYDEEELQAKIAAGASWEEIGEGSRKQFDETWMRRHQIESLLTKEEREEVTAKILAFREAGEDARSRARRL